MKKNDFTERSKILLDLKIILLDDQNKKLKNNK